MTGAEMTPERQIEVLELRLELAVQDHATTRKALAEAERKVAAYQKLFEQTKSLVTSMYAGFQPMMAALLAAGEGLKAGRSLAPDGKGGERLVHDTGRRYGKGAGLDGLIAAAGLNATPDGTPVDWAERGRLASLRCPSDCYIERGSSAFGAVGRIPNHSYDEERGCLLAAERRTEQRARYEHRPPYLPDSQRDREARPFQVPDAG